MNTQVTAKGMQVKAQAEGGIVIANSAQQSWKADATASNSAVADLVPTSTADAVNWYHAVSNDADNANKKQSATDAYTKLTITQNGGLGLNGAAAGNKAVYLVNEFYIKSSSEKMTLTEGLYITSVTATTSTSNTPDLNKALRVAIVLTYTDTATFTKIFAPVSGGETSYDVNKSTNVSAIAAGVKDTVAADFKNIPAYADQTPIKATIYVYYEGEDANCMSKNLATTIDELTVEVTFSTQASTAKSPVATVAKDGTNPNQLNVTVSNAPSDTPTYKWQYRATSADTFADVASGGTDASLTVSADGQYRCIVTYTSGTYTSDAFTYTAN